MILNRELFRKDPTQYTLPNQGVAKVADARDEAALRILRAELETFVCDGEYERGMAKILNAYHTHFGRGAQPAAWISGFYGSGKSHLAKMLRALWVDEPFPDGARPRGLVERLPASVADPLRELSTLSKREGSLHAASGTLGASGGDDAVAATLDIVFRSVGLPAGARYAKLAMWLRDEGILDTVRRDIQDQGRDFETELRNFPVSSRFSDAVLAAKPSLAPTAQVLRSQLKDSFPLEDKALGADEMVRLIRQALAPAGKFPLTLLVLDEAQQFIGRDPHRALAIQTIAEACAERFDGRLLLVATGQSALTDTEELQRIMGRFPVRVSLGEADIDSVIRQTVLRKKADAEKPLRAVLREASGEISRHLRGTKLAHRPDDNDDAVLDYPLLPTRRRLWERVLRTIDSTGLAGQLRSQLQIVLEAAQATADQPLGVVVPADFLYDRFASQALHAGQLSGEVHGRIEKLRAGDERDRLKARVLMLIYMIGRIGGAQETEHGVAATAETIADLLVENLCEGGAALRGQMPGLLTELRDDGAIMEVGGRWRLQTRESAEWDQEFRRQENAKNNDAAAIAEARRTALSTALQEALRGVSSIPHGRGPERRRLHQAFGEEALPADEIGLRIRTGWENDVAAIENEIRREPLDSPIVHLVIPRHRADELRTALIEQLAAAATLDLKGVPATPDAKEARAAIENRRDAAARKVREIVAEAVGQARVFQASGQMLEGSLTEAVRSGAVNALARLYPRFGDADSDGWGKAFELARRSQPDALQAVGHNGPIEAHPVCKEVLAFVGPGRKGSEIRAHFGGKGYGWSQDAVDAALTALDNAGHLRVTGEAGEPVTLRAVDRRKIGPCHIRAETTTVSTQQRLAVRGLLGDAGVPYQRDQELQALPALLAALAEAARNAGGDPPAPERPTVPGLAETQSLSGNDQLVAVAARVADWRMGLAEWKLTAHQIRERLPRFHLARELVAVGADIPEVAALKTELRAVEQERRLLAKPDPVAPIAEAAAAALREAINDAFARFKAAHDAAMGRLREDGYWQRLTPVQKHEILKQVGIGPAEVPKLGSAEEVLAALKGRPLAAWDDMAKAFPARANDALQEAASLLEPAMQVIALRGATLRSQDDLKAWLAEIEAQLSAALEKGPVIVRS